MPSNSSPLFWESLPNTNDGFSMQRSKIPGGWLVRICFLSTDIGSTGASITFVPDPEHKWDGGSLS